jgi:hypothetical protein
MSLFNRGIAAMERQMELIETASKSKDGLSKLHSDQLIDFMRFELQYQKHENDKSKQLKQQETDELVNSMVKQVEEMKTIKVQRGKKPKVPPTEYVDPESDDFNH